MSLADQLGELLRLHPQLENDPRRLEAFLRDVQPPIAPRDIKLVLEVLAHGCVARLRRDGAASIPQLKARLAAETHLTEGAILAGLQAWGRALELLAGVACEAHYRKASSASSMSPKVRCPGSAPGDWAELTLPGRVQMVFRWCPPGWFTMGSPPTEERHYNDEVQVQVKLSRGFWMAETPATQAQWRAVMGTNPSHFKGDTLPVEQVSWNDAVEFCRKLSSSSGVTVSLPTEAQWEYACRAGTRTSFHFGWTITPEQVNYNGYFPYGNAAKGLYRKKTTPVGSFPANAWGLHDMHGNVWEWCADWYGSSLPGGADPTGPLTGSCRVHRGGSWSSYALLCRSAYRSSDGPGDRDHGYGFRPVLIV